MKVTQELTGAPLKAFGFVHVTGLPARRWKEPEVIISADAHDWGRRCGNNGMEVAITVDGEVWLRAIPPFGSEDGVRFDETVKVLCPNRGDAFVPCSNGESLQSHMLFKRVSNPFWDSEGSYPAEPRLAAQKAADARFQAECAKDPSVVR